MSNAMSKFTPLAILLVDGYNIIGIWSSLKKIRDNEGMEAARRGLIEALLNYSAYQGYYTRIVFDAHSQDTPASREEISRHLCVCYTEYGETADTYIERICAAYSKEQTKIKARMIVATSDRAQQLTVVGYGAEWLSAQQLAFEVEWASKRVRWHQRERKKPASRFLANSLDPVAQERLAKLRMGLRS